MLFWNFAIYVHVHVVPIFCGKNVRNWTKNHPKLLHKYTHVHVSIEFEMFMMRVFFTHSLLFSSFLLGGGDYARNLPTYWQKFVVMCCRLKEIVFQIGTLIFLTLFILFILSVFLDMKTMAERLKNRYYCHKRLFISDMTRIFTNCRSYNKPDTEYYKCANTLEKFVMGKLRDAGLVEKWIMEETSVSLFMLLVQFSHIHSWYLLLSLNLELHFSF